MFDKVKIGVDLLKTLLSDQGTQNGIFSKETQNPYFYDLNNFSIQ